MRLCENSYSSRAHAEPCHDVPSRPDAVVLDYPAAQHHGRPPSGPMRGLLSQRKVTGIFAAMTPSLAHGPWSRGQVAATTDIVCDVLGPAVLGAYLYGSAV